MISSFEPFVILLIVFPLVYMRFKYTNRYIAALESIASSLQKIAENKK